MTYGTAEREVFNGRKAVRFSYRVSEPLWGLRFNSAEASVRYRGSFWIDTETEHLLALEAEAEDIPEALRISSIKTRIELQRVAINGSEVTLPRSTLLTIFAVGGVPESENTNRTDFENCRRYTAESTISFGEKEPVAAAAAASPGEVRELRPGLRVLAALETPIDASTSAAGDAISAVVLKPLRDGPVRIPKGARLFGRLLLLQLNVDNANVTAVLNFSRIDAGDPRFPFHARFHSLHWRRAPIRPGELYGDELKQPGTLVLRMRNGLLRIPKGVEMEWVTGQPAER